MIIAIDGPAASGKGTLARRIADLYRLAYLDTGLIYRAVARDTRAQGGDPSDPLAAEAAARLLDASSLDDPALKDRGIADAASQVASHPGVRAVLLDFQRSFARRPGGAVLDGRDIGTVVCPDAPAKLWITARPEVRAFRRHRELVSKGADVTFEHVLAMIAARDARDGSRATAPMKPAPDALLLETSELSIDHAFEEALKLVAQRIGPPPGGS